VAGLNMLRPYGSIGQFSSKLDEFSFGTTAHFDPFSRLSNLGTYTEQKPMHDAAAMQGAIANATLMVFLGFGYHVSNLDLIKIGAGNSGGARVIGTAKGIYHSNRSLIAGRIANNLNINVGSVDLHDMKALDLLTELRPQILMLVE
jgi:hypothetical protein